MRNFSLKGLVALFGLAVLAGNTACSDDDPAQVQVTGISLDRNSASLKKGETLVLTATVLPAGASNKNVSWTSSDTNIATVEDGRVTGMEEGSATITVRTDDGGHTATCALEVMQQAGADVVLQGEITLNTTLKAGDNILLKGFVYVVDGVTLTIEPGAVIKGEKATKGSLIIERGGKIRAEGTREKPIVFTSDQPAGARTYGDWGGLILCGKSIVNNTEGEAKVEGGPRSWYGGTDPDDDSGVLKYVRIEFAGYPLEPNKEINGLTCGGVGRGTTIEYVQVSFCGDDSFEWFGGTVNARYLIAYKGWDDEFDTDYGYQGKLQFLLGIRDPKHADTSKSNGFESDNDADGSGNAPLTRPVFSNVTLIGPLYGVSSGKPESDILYVTEDAPNGAKGGSFQAAMHIRRNSSLKVYNSVFTGWPYGLFLDHANAGATVKNVIFAGMWKNFRNDASQAYFETASLGNSLYDSSNELFARDGDYASVVTDKIGGASFTDDELTDDFFEKVLYKGAFDGVNDWTKDWTNFDPNETGY